MQFVICKLMEPKWSCAMMEFMDTDERIFVRDWIRPYTYGRLTWIVSQIEQWMNFLTPTGCAHALEVVNFSVRNYTGGMHTKLVDIVISEYVRGELNTLRCKNSFLVAGTEKLIGCTLKEYDLADITVAN